MPTAAKLFAAVAFAIVAWLSANASIPGLPEGTRIGMFREITAAIGVIVGWRVMGRLTGGGYTTSMGLGVRTSATIVFWVVLGFAIYEMVRLSLKKRYDGPMEALVSVFGIMIEYGKALGDVQVLAILLIGGMIGGFLAEFAGRRWR